MKFRRLPRTGWDISDISFGCMSLGTDFKSAQGLLHKALDLGINYFDTADLYDKGENEKIVGRALQAHRQEVYIATKVGNQWRPDGSGWDWTPGRKYMLKAVQASLKRLQTDYIDLYQLHGGTIDDPFDEIIETFELLQDQGLIRHYGISSIRPNVIREYVKKSRIASVMMQYSLLDRRPEERCLDILKENGIGVMVRGGMAKGLLCGKPATNYLNYSTSEVAKAASAIQKHRSLLRSPSQICLDFALKGPGVCTVVAGMRTENQLSENVGASGGTLLTDPEHRELRKTLPVNVYEDHR